MSITLRAIAIFGVLIFGALFSITYLSPQAIEGSAKGFVKYQIEWEIREKHQFILDSNVEEQARQIANKLGLESEKIHKDIENKLPEKIASVIASMCGYDCERKKALTQSITSGYLDRLKEINIAQDSLSDLIRGKYLNIINNLKFDLRIFLGSNVAMFLILLTISFTRPKVMAHLFLPGLLLVLTTISASGIYITGQDWFYTILYNDYMGFGYLAYLSLIFGVLLDITLNKARGTTEVINGVANMIGSSFSVVSC